MAGAQSSDSHCAPYCSPPALLPPGPCHCPRGEVSHHPWLPRLCKPPLTELGSELTLAETWILPCFLAAGAVLPRAAPSLGSTPVVVLLLPCQPQLDPTVVKGYHNEV